MLRYSEAFIDDTGTIFQKVSDGKYDYQLNDDYGKDYCTVDQMISWDVVEVKKITIEG